jgi:hypothetical protein
MNERSTEAPTRTIGDHIGDASAAARQAPTPGAGSTGETTTDQAREVVAAARGGAAETLSEAKGQAGEVLHEAKAQARTVVEDAKREVHAQASQQTERAAEGLRSLAGQVRALAEGRASEAGIAGDYARRLGERVSEVADRMERGGLDGVLGDVRRFARRRPGTFLVGAAAVGFAAGRLLRAGAAQGADGPGAELAPHPAGPSAPMVPAPMNAPPVTAPDRSGLPSQHAPAPPLSTSGAPPVGPAPVTPTPPPPAPPVGSRPGVGGAR